jgi:hypothetical protein
MRFLKSSILFLFTLLILNNAQGQYKVQGTVYDSSRTYPLSSVSVMSTSGKGTVTNANGFYRLEIQEQDSIWFSYLNKPTIKFPVLKITDHTQFDIALQVPIQILPEVLIKPRSYRLDSLQNRTDYAKVFDFRRPNLETMTSIGASGAAFDIQEIIRLFQFRKNRSMMSFQNRLLQQEKDKYIDYRFSKALVRRLTEASDEELNTYMILYRPTYEFILYSSDYDFQHYIKESFKKYKSSKQF